MDQQTLLATLQEGVRNERVKPQLAAYIAAELLRVDPHTTGYDDTVRIDDADRYWHPAGMGRSSGAVSVR